MDLSIIISDIKSMVFSMAFSAPADRQTMADLSSKLGHIDCEWARNSHRFLSGFGVLNKFKKCPFELDH